MESSFVVHDLTSLCGVLVRNARLDECMRTPRSYYMALRVYVESSCVMQDLTSVCGVLVSNT